jgi:hypothetical protein
MVADHIANGMYGLILVEPPGGLPHVDHEYYVMQGEIYASAPKGKSGLQQFSEQNLMQESPEYFVYNGAHFLRECGAERDRFGAHDRGDLYESLFVWFADFRSFDRGSDGRCTAR